MIPYHARIIAADVARVLIHQVLHLVLLVEHQHQCDDGKLAAGTRLQVPLTTSSIGIDGRNKLLHIACLNGLARPCIRLAGILIRGIVREVAANHKQILVRKIRLQYLRHPLQFLVVIGADNDRHNRRDLLIPPLQEWQLHLQTMLPIVRLRPVEEDRIRCR